MRDAISTPGSSSLPALAPLPDAARAGAAEAGATRRRWYTHRLNTALSLRLILGIIPRVPRFLVPPIGVVTTAVCIIFMRRERQATARNLSRVLGVRGWRLRRAVWRQFYAFSRFMVSHCDLGDPDPEALHRWLSDDAGGQSSMRAALEGGRGLIAVTAHLGNWEAGMRLLGLTGAPVHVVMRADRASAAERWLMGRRAGPNLRVLRLDDGPAASLALRAALQRNEIVAMQGDRLIGGRSLTVNLFGAPFGLPSGPFALAYVCQAPLLPVFVVQDGWWRWHAEVGEPIRFPRTADRDTDLKTGAEQYAAELEQAVLRHPDQWFNFYDLWPTEAGA